MKKKTLLTAVFLAAALAFASAPVTGLAADKNTKTAVKTQTIPKEITDQVLKLWQTQKMVNNGHKEI